MELALVIRQYVQKYGPCTVKELADWLGVSRHCVGGIVGQSHLLERVGRTVYASPYIRHHQYGRITRKDLRICRRLNIPTKEQIQARCHEVLKQRRHEQKSLAEREANFAELLRVYSDALSSK